MSTALAIIWTVLQVLVALVVGVGVWVLTQKVVARTQCRGKQLPGPPQHWLLGNVPQVAAWVGNGNHLDTLIRKFSKDHGKLFALNLLARDFVPVLDPDAIKEILVTKAYPKSPTYDGLFPFIGAESMLVAKPDVWHRQRKAYTPAFSYASLKNLVPIFVEKGTALMAQLQEVAESQETIKMLDILTLCTMDIICQVTLSENFHFMDSQTPPPIHRVFMELLDIAAYYSTSPHKKYERMLPWNSRHINNLQAKFDKLILDVVHERLIAAAALASNTAASSKGGSGSSSSTRVEQTGPVSIRVSAGSEADTTGGEAVTPLAAPHDILGMAIQTALEDGTGGLNENEILSQVKTFLFAGHDTTASTLGFTVYELSQHPEVEAKVVDELQAVGAFQRALDGTLTSNDLNSLKYMNLVIKEVLRMWPPGGTARMAPAGSTLQGFDIGLKILYIPHFVVHRDTDLFGPDADEFRPERWQDEAYVAALHPFAYQPFSKGARDCIGQTFATLEAKALLAMLYARFSFRYMGDKPEEQSFKITSHPMFHVPVRVVMRHP